MDAGNCAYIRVCPCAVVSINLDSLVIRHIDRCTHVSDRRAATCVDPWNLHLDLMLLNHLQETLPNLVKLFVQIVLKNLFLHLNLMQLFLHAP